MNYGIFNQLNDIFKNIQSDITALGLTIAVLMIVIYVIMIMVDSNSAVGVHKDRWEQLRKVFVCIALLASAGAIAAFAQQIGQGLHL